MTTLFFTHSSFQLDLGYFFPSFASVAHADLIDPVNITTAMAMARSPASVHPRNTSIFNSVVAFGSLVVPPFEHSGRNLL